MNNSTAIADDFIREARTSVEASAERIKHCLDQLNDQQVWWRAADSQNSIGNLILHVCGNLRQRLGSVVGGQADARDRTREFSERGPIPKDDLIAQLDEAVDTAVAVLARLDAAALAEDRRYQGLGREVEATVLGVILRTLAHLAGHGQEIVYITRLQLGDDYEFLLKPP